MNISNDLKEIRHKFESIKTKACFPKLYYAEIHPTNRCNLDCYFCNQLRYRNAGPADLSYSIIKKALIEMKDLGLRTVRLSGGGEPTVHPQFKKIIQVLQEHNLGLNLTTNGLIRKKSLMDSLLETRWSAVQFSLLASDFHDWCDITGGTKKAYATVLDNIRYLSEWKHSRGAAFPQIMVHFGVGPLTYMKLVHAYKLVCDLRVDAVLFHTYNNIDYPEEVISASDSILRQLEDIQQENERSGILKSIIFDLSDLNLNDRLVEKIEKNASSKASTNVICTDNCGELCFMPWMSTFIRANGDVEVCAAKEPSFPTLGNIHDESILAIWNGKQYRDFRNNFEELIFSKDNSSIKDYQSNRCVAHGNHNFGCSLKCGWEKFKVIHEVE